MANIMEDNDIFLKSVEMMTRVSDDERRMAPQGDAPLPSVDALREMVELVKMVVFPGFFDKRQIDSDIRSYHIGVNMERLCSLMRKQLTLALCADGSDERSAETEAAEKSLKLIGQLPLIKHLLYTDVEAIFDDDPAASSHSEVIFSYPVIQAMVHYRFAHVLHEMDIPVIPRIITEQAHANTGIDIHPGAKIGEYFSIDHGTGVVIGETCVIGNHVHLFQGVTLGAAHTENPYYTLHQQPSEETRRDRSRLVPRHPVLEDHVTVYSNSTLLGRITIGHDTVIGGNVWLTHSVPANSTIMQSKAMDVSFTGGLGI